MEASAASAAALLEAPGRGCLGDATSGDAGQGQSQSPPLVVQQTGYGDPCSKYFLSQRGLRRLQTGASRPRQHGCWEEAAA